MADQTDAGETLPRAVSAGKCDVWCGWGGGAGLPPLSLVCPLRTGHQLGGLSDARPHGQQQGQTTACGRFYRWRVTSSGCP